MLNPKNNYNGTKVEFEVNTTCHLCQNQYKTVSNLNRHIRNKHHTEPTEHARKRIKPKASTEFALDSSARDASANTTNPVSLTPLPSTLPPSTPPSTPPPSTTSTVDEPITLARDS